MGGVVTFECASGRRFASDWDTTPATVSITCMSDGNFSAPDEWEECSSSIPCIQKLMINRFFNVCFIRHVQDPIRRKYLLEKNRNTCTAKIT